jgi:hypothetical protein
MGQIPPDLAGHPDRLRWNARYGDGFAPSFIPHPLAVRALSQSLPGGPVLELASGPSGSALLAAASGRPVTAADASEVALGLLADEANRRGLLDMITPIHVDLGTWRPEASAYSLVLCTGFWDREVFAAGMRAVTGGGLVAWEALTANARSRRPSLPAQWCVEPGEPACLLPPDFDVLDQHDVGEHAVKRQLLARRQRPR